MSASQLAATELLRRRRARKSLVDYANAIDIPGRPIGEDEDAWIFAPVETTMAAHHLLLLRFLDEVANGDGPRQGMIFMPPGSAKSTFASVVFPTWQMGRIDGHRVILASYASDIARKQARRARQIVRSQRYRSIFQADLSKETAAADEWSLSNESEMMACGILAGVTGNRAEGLIIDDPVAGREEADSETIRKKTREAYEDDLTTRLVPGAYTLLIQTRWHEEDLAGGLLPLDWQGESGDIACRDGLTWRVLCLPAIAERADDPLGRAVGDRLWPEWFDDAHFARFKRNARTWSALYQQRPAPETGSYFLAEWLRPYKVAPPRDQMRIFGASDYAVTEAGGDWTVHVIIGVDMDDRLWLLDLWRGQTASDEWVETWCDLVKEWKPIEWAEETGQIKSGVGPFLTRRALERKAFCFRRQFPTRGDKAVRAQSIRGRMAMQGLNVPADAPWLTDFKRELMSFPAGRHDDQVDALGLAGQLLDHMEAIKPRAENPAPPPDELEFVAGPGGIVRANMDVKQYVEMKMRKRKRHG